MGGARVFGSGSGSDLVFLSRSEVRKGLDSGFFFFGAAFVMVMHAGLRMVEKWGRRFGEWVEISAVSLGERKVGWGECAWALCFLHH